MVKIIRAARHYQKPDAPIRGVALAGRKALARDMRAAIGGLSREFDRKKALRLFLHGQIRQIATEAINWHHFREVLKAVFTRWATIFEAGAKLGERKINGALHGGGRKVRFRKDAADTTAFGEKAFQRNDAGSANVISLYKDVGNRFGFDHVDEQTIQLLQDAQAALIQQLTDSARGTILAAVTRGHQLGLSAEDIVDQIRDVIGLTDSQALAVMNYRNMVNNLDADALQRQLRDSQYDSALQAALDDGTPLHAAMVDEMVSAYESNYLDYRAKTIAQSESVRAANVGLHEAYRQAIDRGALPTEAITRFWQLGDAPCPICESIPDSNSDGVGVEEDFDSIDGPQDDPPVHPNCECSVEYVTDLDKVPEE